jgi:hypothetical protein
VVKTLSFNYKSKGEKNMGPLDKLEAYLVGVSKQLPQIPKNAKKTIADIAPWVVLVVGLWFLLSAYWMWSWARVANVYVDWANRYSEAFGGPTVSTNRFTIAIWVALIVGIVTAVLYLVSFPSLRKYKKTGWNLLFIASFVNLIYGVVMIFNSYGGFFSFVYNLVFTAAVWYVLFQIREIYLGKKAEPAKTVHNPEKKK